MKYRNTKTGYEFESESICKGQDIELVEEKEAEDKKPATKKRTTVKK